MFRETALQPFLLQPDHAAVLAGQARLDPVDRRNETSFRLQAVLLIVAALWIVGVLIALAAQGPGNAQAATSMVCPAIWGALVFVPFMQIRRKRAVRRRLAAGFRLVPAHVRTCRTIVGRAGQHWVVVDYEFVSPTGRTLAGRATEDRKDLRGMAPLPPGTPLAIAYLDDQAYELL